MEFEKYISIKSGDLDGYFIRLVLNILKKYIVTRFLTNFASDKASSHRICEFRPLDGAYLVPVWVPSRWPASVRPPRGKYRQFRRYIAVATCRR